MDAGIVLRFFLTRGLEYFLPASVLYWMLKPRAFVRARHWQCIDPVMLPSCLGDVKIISESEKCRTTYHLNRMLELIPDRLGTAKWKKRYHIAGLEGVKRASQEKRPVIMAFCHFGPFHLLPVLLRAGGLPMASIEVTRPKFSILKNMRDRRSPFPDSPTIFGLNQLREAIEFLTDGNPLLVALDHPGGKQMDVPITDGWNFQMAAGAVRLAARYQAQLIPCCIIDEGRWHFRIEFGRPVPDTYLMTEKNWSRAGKHLLDEMFIHFRKFPAQCTERFIRCFQQTSRPVF